MGSDNTEPRESTDSIQSTTPFIQPATFQPPPRFPEGHGDGAPSNDGTVNIKISVVVLICRFLAFISSLAIGISFAVLGAWWAVTILFVITIWTSFVWHGLVLNSHRRSKPSLRISLVLSDGRVFRFGSHGDDEGEARPRRRDLRVFVVDLALLIALITLNVVNLIHPISWHRTPLGLSWFPISFQLLVILLTAIPKLFTAHVRVESADSPQIALP
ncbi:hypothetical protein F4678DRAFT_27150 [Xylaria arbuscula]|nr:hypothetical protein F4678DRAFT_27150 [Xylaria arbuscula]